MRRASILKEVLKRVKIFYDGECISQNGACEKGIDFLSESFKKEEHNIAFWLHSGSIAYSINAFVVAVLANMIMDETSSNDTIENISIGTLVEYKKTDKKILKCKYVGKYEGNDKTLTGMYMFKSKDGGTIYLPKQRLYSITPYYGNSQSLSSIVLGKKTSMRVSFLKNVVGLNDLEISSIPGLSTVVYMKESVLDDILERTHIEIDDNQYMVRDLVRVTFYTATNEHRKAGNASNNEPAIKVSYNIDRIMELVADSQGTEILGFAALDNSIYKRYASDFERLLKRKRISYSWLISKYEYSEWLNGYLDGENNQLAILPYEHSFIKRTYLKYSEETRFNVLTNLELQISSNKKVDTILVPDVMPWKEYRTIKDKIRFVIKNSNDIDYIVSFARWAYSMLKFFNNAVFTIQDYENKLSVTGRQLILQIEENEKKIELFPGILREKSEEIINYIKKLYESFGNQNKKIDTIKKYISDNEYQKVLFVVSNNTFASLLNEYVGSYMRFKRFNYQIITESKLENVYIGERFDLVVYASLMNYESYHPYNNTLAPNTVVLVYDSQIRIFNKIMRLCEAFEKKINKFVKNSSYKEEVRYEKTEEEDDYVLDKEFKDYFIQSFVKNESYQGRGSTSNHEEYEHFLEAYKYGQFADGYQIIFTKNYIAYVLDDEKGAIEKKVDELIPGDELLFTINDNKTKDLVDELLENVCDSNKQLRNEYGLSQSWKRTLRYIRNKEELTYGDLVKHFKKLGKNTTEQTIRSWIDVESHIVGPKTVEDYVYIGKVIGDREMIENPQMYYDAASSIRKTRIKLLKLIKYAMFYDTENKSMDQIDSIFNYEIIEKIKEITVIKRLEDIKKIESFNIPIGRANTPIEF